MEKKESLIGKRVRYWRDIHDEESTELGTIEGEMKNGFVMICLDVSPFPVVCSKPYFDLMPDNKPFSQVK